MSEENITADVRFCGLQKTELRLPSELYHYYHSKLARKLGGDESEERQTALATSPPIHNATQMGDAQVRESETGIHLRSQSVVVFTLAS